MKKIFLIIVFLLIINLKLVNAKELTLNDIKDKINEVSLNMNAYTSDNELIVNNHNTMLTFKLENNILSRTGIYEKNTLNSVDDLYLYLNLTKIIAFLKGYQVKEIEYFLTDLDNATMIKDGYEVTKRKINGNIELTYQIDLNNFKINFNYINASKPEISIYSIEDNIVTLLINSTDKEIDLYRSTDNKNYEYLTTLEMIDGKSIYTNKLDVNNTYYYKAVVKMANNYSEVVEVNFPKEKIDTNYLDEKVENPLTGYEEFASVSMLIIIAIIGIIGNINLKRKVYR